jgi:hypothetical protein
VNAVGDDEGARRIDVAIVGAQRCGTTTLAALLSDHPQICLAVGKEAHLFDDPIVQRGSIEPVRFDGLFAHRQPGQLLLDATPSYLYLPGCIDALVRHNEQVKVIVILRPAADRAMSHHDLERRRGTERRRLLSAVVAERRRLRADRDALASRSAHRLCSYLDRGRYLPQLQRLMSATDRVCVVSLARLAADPAGVLTELHRFLGIDERPVHVAPRLNRGGGRAGGLSRVLLATLTRREMHRTETHLGWPRGSLRA